MQKFGVPMSKSKDILPDSNSLWKYNFDIEVKGQGHTKFMTVCVTSNHGDTPACITKYDYAKGQKRWGLNKVTSFAFFKSAVWQPTRLSLKLGQCIHNIAIWKLSLGSSCTCLVIVSLYYPSITTVSSMSPYKPQRSFFTIVGTISGIWNRLVTSKHNYVTNWQKIWSSSLRFLWQM